LPNFPIFWKKTSQRSIHWLLSFFEHYNWGCECCTSVIMTSSHFDTWHPTKYQNGTWLKKNCRKSDSFLKTFDLQPFFHENTSPSHENLRRVSKSPLLHLFTHCRSGTLDWHVMRATSADSSRLIHSILAHSSTLHYHSIICYHRTHNHTVLHAMQTCVDANGYSPWSVEPYNLLSSCMHPAYIPPVLPFGNSAKNRMI
jgi:hypothetical protein